MRILDLATEGFKVPDGVHPFRDAKTAAKDVWPAEASDLVVVVGPPGSGKSVFLRLVAAAKEVFAPYGSPPDLRRLLRSGRKTGKLTARFVLSEADLASAGVEEPEVTIEVNVEPSGSVAVADEALRKAFGPLDSASPVTRWELFPAPRSMRVDQWEIGHPPLSAAIEAARRLTADPTKYEVLRRVFFEAALAQATEIARALDGRGVALAGEGTDRFGAYRAAVATMCPDLRLDAVEMRAAAAAPTFARRSGERVTIAELTGSEEQGVLFAFAAVWLGLRGGLVLVDTPEIGISTGEQAGFVERLLALGQGSQTVLATGSPEIAAIAGAAIIDLGRPGARP